MSNAFRRFIETPTPQSRPADERQVQNNAGGFTFEISNETRLRRILTLGTEGGTYYQNWKTLTGDAIDFVKWLIRSDEDLVRRTVIDVSTSGSAYRNTPAIYVVALLIRYGRRKADSSELVTAVCRTSTHLFELATYLKSMGGWNRTKRTAVARWYESLPSESLAYQLIKYRQRDGMTHRDMLRMAHPRGLREDLVHFALGKDYDGHTSSVIEGYLTLRTEFDARKSQSQRYQLRSALNVLEVFPSLPWEAIPTELLTEPEIWKKLFFNGQLRGQALVRNVTRLARIGAFSDMHFARAYAERLTDVEMIRHTRLHPLNYLNALVVHREGQVDRSNSSVWSAPIRKRTWEPSGIISDALEEGFYLSFKYVEPAGKRTLLAVDVSGSMSAATMGLDLSCAQVSAAIAMTVARTEPLYEIRGFTAANHRHSFVGLTNLGITAKSDITTAMQRVSDANFGGTDCALPMMWALDSGTAIDTFVVLTDNETWAGRKHPHVALREYRQRTGIDARLIVVGMTATNFTIADPTDAGMLDVAGADANLPRLIANFSAGRI